MFSFRRVVRTAISIATVIALVGLGSSVATAITPVEALGTPDLKGSSDTGVSNTDDETNDSTPTIVAVGSTTCDPDRELVRQTAPDTYVTVAATCAVVDAVAEYTPSAAVSPDGVHTFAFARGDTVSDPLDITLDTVGLPAEAGAPGEPDLQAASDSGASATDNVTNKKSTATFDVAGDLPEGAAAIELLRAGASVPKSGLSGTYGPSPITDTSTRADGTYAYSARFVDTAGNGGTASTALSVVFDTSGLVLALFSSNCDSGRLNNDTYTRGLCAGLTGPFAALNNLYVGFFTVVGGSNNLPITVSRKDPNGTVTALANLTPTAATGGAAFLLDILSVLPGSPPTNGKWTYTLGGTDLAGNTLFGSGSMTIDTVEPSLPVVDLTAGSDSGAKNDDNVTQWNATGVNTTLGFTVTSEVDSAVDFYRNGAPVGTQQTVPGTAPEPKAGVVIPTDVVSFTDDGKFPDARLAYTLSAWHGFVAQVTDRAGNQSAGSLPVYVDVDAPVAPLQLDLLAEDDHGTANDDNVTNLESPRFQVRGAEDGATVEMTACEGPGCTLVLSLSPFVTRSTRTANPVGSAAAASVVVIGTTTGNGVIQPSPGWWKHTAINRLDNYTAGNGPALPGNGANTSWRFNVRQRDLSGRQGATYSQDLNVVIDTTPLPAPSRPEFVAPGDLTIASMTTGSSNPTFRIAEGQGRVELLRNGTVVASRTGGGLITDPGPLANGTYTYTSRAVDTAGNISAASAAETITVQNGGGYWLVASDGGVFTFGDAGYFGSMGGTPLNAPVLAVAPTPTKKGYWLLGQDGGVFSLGDAGFYGSTGDKKLNSPILGMVPSKTGKGYWLFAPDGGVFAFGDAPFLGAPASSSPTSPIVAMQAAPDGKGYWLVAANGQVYAYGSASSLSGLENDKLNSPIVGAAATGSGKGLWLVGADGGVFTLGDASFHGSTGGMTLNQPIIGIAGLPGAGGYYLLGKDGGVFSFGAASFHGSTGGMTLNKPVVGMAIS